MAVVAAKVAAEAVLAAVVMVNVDLAAEAVTDYMPVRIGLECRVISFVG